MDLSFVKIDYFPCYIVEESKMAQLLLFFYVCLFVIFILRKRIEN